MEEASRQLHTLEIEFGLSAAEILDVINHRNRCKIAVRGAIAEAHLKLYFERLVEAGQLERFIDFDRDGYPDYEVVYQGETLLVEVKNVRQYSGKNPDAPIRVEIQRTRAPIGKPWERYYAPSEFAIVAACLWNRTRQWEYRFAAVETLPRHPQYPDRLATIVPVDRDPEQVPGSIWYRALPELLARR